MQDRYTALYKASNKGHVGIVTLLLQQDNIDVNIKNKVNIIIIYIL